ncbi:MAG: T9SS type A sorting domain-containing protein [Ignavibacteriales bacterium]|nr:T9SS type A sorting domain-containing protein [Ignavibacteriales bacterium]
MAKYNKRFIKNGSYIAVAQTAAETPATEKTGVSVENYPNPFNPSTTISYTIPEDGKVLLKVFDVLGREITTLINEFTIAGKHNVAWDGTNFASGIYFYSVTFKGKTLNKKMLLVK